MTRDENIIHEIRTKQLGISDFRQITFCRLSGGMNNHIYKIITDEGGQYLLKIYVLNEPDRLKREFGACSYLTENNLPAPKALYKNELKNYAIYSFEKGIQKKADLMEHQDIEKMVDFLTNVENLRPEYTLFDKSVAPFIRLYDYIKYVEMRQNILETSLHNKELDKRINKFFDDTQLVTLIEKEKRKLSNSIDIEDWNKELNIDQQVLSPLDFGPHNALFTPEGKITFIDLEKFGWDDPTHVVVSFVNHIQTRALKPELKKYFLELYFEKSSYSKIVKKRLSQIIQIDRLGWIAFLANTLTPDRLSHYLDALPNIKKEEYINGQIGEIETRLDELSIRPFV